MLKREDNLHRQLHRFSLPPCDLIVPPYAYYTEYSQAVRRGLKAWNPARVIPPKDFRNTIQTVAELEGWSQFEVDRFVGHAGRMTTRQKHYRGTEELLEQMDEKVMARIDFICDEWPTPKGCWLIPGPQVVKFAK